MDLNLDIKLQDLENTDDIPDLFFFCIGELSIRYLVKFKIELTKY